MKKAYMLGWHNYQSTLLHERNKVQDCECCYNSYENVPLRSPAAGKINTHSYENVPLRSPAAEKINIGHPKQYTQHVQQPAPQSFTSHGLPRT